MTGAKAPVKVLACRVQHIFDKDSVPPCGVVHKNVGYRTDQFPVLNDRAAAHG